LPHCNQAVCVGMMEVTIWANIDQCKALAWRSGSIAKIYKIGSKAEYEKVDMWPGLTGLNPPIAWCT
jgi:hypothetical protein